ncbi:aldehyde dehydrogenase family protein [Paraburkholderia fungorum]
MERARSAAGALARAGCTSIVKPAAQTSLLNAAMMHCLDGTALPKGAVNVVNESGHAAGERLVDSQDVDVVRFDDGSETST